MQLQITRSHRFQLHSSLVTCASTASCQPTAYNAQTKTRNKLTVRVAQQSVAAWCSLPLQQALQLTHQRRPLAHHARNRLLVQLTRQLHLR